MYQAMAEESQKLETVNLSKKRRLGRKKGNKTKKKLKGFDGSGERIKIDRRMKKLFRKRARDYNSDDDEDEGDDGGYAVATKGENAVPIIKEVALDGKDSSEEEEDHQDIDEANEISEDEEGEIQPGITKLTEGCRAFRLAFKKIIKKNVSDVSLGPVLSGHKKLVAEKLAEEEADQKVKGDVKKEKHLLGEKGHVKPANFLDSHEKFLIGVATKGVVKLFNAVNKAQNAQKGLNASRFKDEKAIIKRRKEAFFSELGKTAWSSAGTPAKAHTSSGPVDGEGPAWAPLRDSYMLTSSKLKNWDKMPDSITEDEIERMPLDSSDDD